MKKYILLTLLIIKFSSCQDQLDIVNPNQPTIQSASTEQGIIALAQGALYINGLQVTKFGGTFFGVVLGYHERMGDLVNTTPANFDNNRVSCPNKITLDDGSLLLNPNTPGIQKEFLQTINIPSSEANPFFYEWSFMYSLNGAMNNVLPTLESINLTETKKNTIKAWVYFWKGFAYSRIGSMYIAGIINEETSKTNDLYVTRAVILSHAEANYAKAESLLSSLTPDPEYFKVMNSLIPSVCQVGKGFAPSPQEWLRHINTLRARNILVNTPVADLTTTQLDDILALATDGLRQTDNTFTIRTDELNNLLRPQGFGGYVAGQTTGPASSGGGINQVSERLIQEFRPGDARLDNNFVQIPTFIGPPDRGTAFNTRYLLVNGGNGMPGVVVMCNRTIGAQELYIAGSYEENLLMLAEANIYKGNIDGGLAQIDELRNYQGSGLAATAGTGLTLDQAKEELRSERRVGLAFYGLSFYDARRWGVLQNGRTGCVVVDFDGNVNTNATIDYGYLEYWDVPIAESFYNPPSSDSAPIVNPD